MKSKEFKSKASNLKVEVIENGWINIYQDEGEDTISIAVGGIDGLRAQLIKDAFEYAKKRDGE